MSERRWDLEALQADGRAPRVGDLVEITGWQMRPRIVRVREVSSRARAGGAGAHLSIWVEGDARRYRADACETGWRPYRDPHSTSAYTRAALSPITEAEIERRRVAALREIERHRVAALRASLVARVQAATPEELDDMAHRLGASTENAAIPRA